MPPAPLGLLQRGLDRVRLLVGVEDHAPVDVPRGAADRLDERAVASQEAFLVGVEDRDERDLGEVESFAQEVDADERVELPEPQAPQDRHALQRLDVGVEVLHLEAEVAVVGRQVLAHPLREARDEHAVRRPPRVFRISPSRSSTWPRAGAISTIGSTSPVGRITCSAVTPPERWTSRSDGVADTATSWRTRPSNSSALSGRLSSARRKPEPELDERLLARAIAPVHSRRPAASRRGFRR